MINSAVQQQLSLKKESEAKQEEDKKMDLKWSEDKHNFWHFEWFKFRYTYLKQNKYLISKVFTSYFIPQ